VLAKRLLKDSRLGLPLALLLAGSMWFYVQKVLIPHQEMYAAVHKRPRGNLSDLYPRWLGARELLLHHRDPYSPEVTREIQKGYYGRALEADHAADPHADEPQADEPKDQQGFAYPVYVVFLLEPTVRLPFPVVQSGFRWLLLILTMVSVPLWLRVLRWRPPIAVTAILMILTIGSFPVVQGFKLQQLSLLVGGLIAACAAALVAGYFSLAGFLLAVATIKPQLVVPMAGWLVLWAISDWKRRWRFVASLCATAAVLFAASEYILPGWLGRFREAVAAYRQYTGGAGSLLDVLATPTLGRVIAAAAVITVTVVCWHFRRVTHDSVAFGVILALVLAVTLMILPTFAPYNQILLLPAVFFVVNSWKSLWNRNRPARMACVVGALVVFWPWLAACGMMLAGRLLPLRFVEQAWAAPLYTSLAIPLVVLGLLSLCAIDSLRASPSST
jgi:hypothetical protein